MNKKDSIAVDEVMQFLRAFVDYHIVETPIEPDVPTDAQMLEKNIPVLERLLTKKPKRKRARKPKTVSYSDYDKLYDTDQTFKNYVDARMRYARESVNLYTQTFLTDRKNGDFDTRALLYVITPDGERIDLNVYKTDDGNGGWKQITKEEYDALLEKRIDKLSRKVAEHLLWTLIENSSNDETTRKRREAFALKTDADSDRYHDELTEMCKFFENPDNYQHNTFEVVQKLCRGDVQGFAPELVKIAEYLKYILGEL